MPRNLQEWISLAIFKFLQLVVSLFSRISLPTTRRSFDDAKEKTNLFSQKQLFPNY